MSTLFLRIACSLILRVGYANSWCSQISLTCNVNPNKIITCTQSQKASLVDFLFVYLCLKHAQMSDGFLSAFYIQMMCAVHVFERVCVCVLMYIFFFSRKTFGGTLHTFLDCLSSDKLTHWLCSFNTSAISLPLYLDKCWLSWWQQTSSQHACRFIAVILLVSSTVVY